MSAFEALVLGIVQGLTEFLPVSSSGHLTLAPFFFGWDEPTLAFAVAAHIGTLAAIVWVYKETLGRLMRAVLGWANADPADKVLIKLLAIGTIPAIVAGVVFKSAIGDAFERPVLVSLLLGVTAYLLFSSETIYEQRETDPVEGQKEMRDLEHLTTVDAATIGIGQALAIMPGISRSGATIAFGMRRGVTRQGAAAFSFLLSIPAIAGAAVYEIPDMLDQGTGGDGAAMAIGIIAAGLSGFFAVRWFLRVIQRVGMRPFGIYCLLLMIAGLLTALARG